jgi:hypothetical protein
MKIIEILAGIISFLSNFVKFFVGALVLLAFGAIGGVIYFIDLIKGKTNLIK